MKLFNFLLFTFSFVFANSGEGSGEGSGAGSGDAPDPIQAQIETTVEIDLKTEIEYDADLLDKNTDAYSTKKAALFNELKPAFESAAASTDSEVVEDGFDVTFSEIETSRKRRDDAAEKMAAKVSQKYLSKRTEAFSDDLQNGINENVRSAVEGEVKKTTDAAGADSLLTKGQAVVATASSEQVGSSGKELKVCSTVFFAVVALGLIN